VSVWHFIITRETAQRAYTFCEMSDYYSVIFVSGDAKFSYTPRRRVHCYTL